MRVSRLPCLLLLLGVSFAADAQTEAAGIRQALAALNAEQQAVYQQFQMLQSLKNQSATATSMPPQPGPPQDYDELVRQRQAAADRANSYQSDMDALYERYKALETEKQPMLARLRELALQPPPAKTPALPPRPAAAKSGTTPTR